MRVVVVACELPQVARLIICPHWRAPLRRLVSCGHSDVGAGPPKERGDGLWWECCLVRCKSGRPAQERFLDLFGYTACGPHLIRDLLVLLVNLRTPTHSCFGSSQIAHFHWTLIGLGNMIFLFLLHAALALALLDIGQVHVHDRRQP